MLVQAPLHQRQGDQGLGGAHIDAGPLAPIDLVQGEIEIDARRRWAAPGHKSSIHAPDSTGFCESVSLFYWSTQFYADGVTAFQDISEDDLVKGTNDRDR